MATTYLEGQLTSFPDLAKQFEQCISFLDKKLYHQLTDLIDELLGLKPNGFNFVEFEERVIRGVRLRMNLLRYAEIAVKISLFNLDNNPKEGIDFIKQAIDAIDDSYAILLLRSQIAYFELKQDWKQCKESLELIETDIKSHVKAPPPTVFAHFYFVQALLWQNQNDSEKFYRNGMSYLGYSSLESVENSAEWAENLAMAALVSPQFYDFGELSLHPIMQSLKGTEREWVLDVLTSFIDANLNTYQDTMQKYKKEISNESVLKDKDSILEEKIRLLALVRLAFDKPSFERVLPFDEISNVTASNVEQVERLIMRAMSLGLIEGIIDEIDSEVSITRVKPRILDLQDIKNLENKTQAWMDKISDTQNEIEPIISNLFK